MPCVLTFTALKDKEGEKAKELLEATLLVDIKATVKGENSCSMETMQ